MKVNDWSSLGTISLRHHVGTDTHIALRNVPQICRTGGPAGPWGVGRDLFGVLTPEQKNMGGEDTTQGDGQCGTWWDYDPDSAENRGIPGWVWGAWPAAISTSAKDGAPDPSATPGTVSPRGLGFAGTFSAVVGGPGGGSKALPVRTQKWDRDTRFREKPIALPLGMTLPVNWPVLVIAGTEERSQEDLAFPVGGLLCAPFKGGHDYDGTWVYDAKENDELDKVRRARLQSLVRVFEVPAVCKNAQSLFGTPGLHGLSIQCGTPKKDFPGLGMFSDDGEAPLVWTPHGFVPDPDAPRRQIISPLSYRVSGPLHPGFGKGDPHYFGTADSDEFSAGGIQTGAYFIEPNDHSKTGPVNFSGDYPEDVTEGPIKVRAYLSWRRDLQHDFICGRRQGSWDFWSTSFLYSPPGIDEGDPRTPPNPGNPPPGDPRTPPNPTPTEIITPDEPGRPVTETGDPTGGPTPRGGTPDEALIRLLERSVGLGETGFSGGVFNPFDPQPGVGGGASPQDARETLSQLGFIASLNCLAAPQFMLRPGNMDRKGDDVRNNLQPTDDQIDRVNKTAPIIGQLVGVASQTGEVFDYTAGQGRTGGLFRGAGAASGAGWWLNGDADVTNFLDGTTPPRSGSTFRVGFTDGTRLAWGVPLANGKTGSGVEIYRSAAGILMGATTDATGAVTATNQVYPPSGSSTTNCVYGDGSDGAVNFDGTNTFASFATTTGAAPNLVYTLTRDVFATTAQVQALITVKLAGHRILASVSVTVDGTASNNGSDAAGGVAGLGAPQGTLGNGGAGGAPPATAGGSTTSSYGGAGGHGGGVNFPGSAAPPSATTQTIRSFPPCIQGYSTAVFCGGGGGSRGNNGFDSAGGGGGGPLIIASPVITVALTGTVQANGGVGGSGVGTQGGGGGGGYINLATPALTNLGLVEAKGGAGGTGWAVAGKGVDGTVFNIAP